MQAAFWTTVGLLCLTAGFGSTQKPQPCSSPPLYTGSMTVGTQDEHLWAVGRYSYDVVNQRMHLGETGTLNNKTFTYDALMLYQEGILYEINHHNKTCVKKPLKADFYPMEVPKGAEFVNQVVIGTLSGPGEGLLVNSWWGDMPDKQSKYFLSFTEFGCFPVSAFFKSKSLGGMVSVSYYDNVLGVDPGVFVPPPFCKDAKLEANKDGKETNYFSFFN
ncbi:ependymin-like [Engraulis encrasicolus]|uniref:ependymin-like n=1 Tax=Engraulis encrasicolus TaxID=184585 RepID=UPI002FCFB9A7